MEPYLGRKSIRLLLVGLGLFLLFSGVLTLLNPRSLIVGHQYQRWRVYAMGFSVEYVSKEGSVAYGIATTALGLAAFIGAFLGDTRIARSDRAVAQGVVIVAPELLKRYGRIEDSTFPQIAATAEELRISRGIVPYLFAAFLGRNELEALEARMPGVNWSEVERRIDRILVELPHEDLLGTHFHESWRMPD
jgi:hypothetical protein